MLQLSAKLYDRPLLSLRTGQPIGRTTQPIVDPRNLKIIGFYCRLNSQKTEKVLLTEDVREFFDKGLIINDEEVLADPEDLVRLADLLKSEYELIDKPVFTVSDKKLGKVSDYTFDHASLYIMQLYVSQPFFKNLSSSNLIIDRTSINEISDKKIVIDEDTEKTAEPEMASA